jgi:site-specific DNA recombinase
MKNARESVLTPAWQDPAGAVLSARAFSYVRVSSDEQTKTDYSDDGLSMDAQRIGAADKAAQLSAQIVAEFADPGHSAYVDLHKRTDFLEMLEELKRRNQNPATRVDYVIVWDLSRFCRNVADHFATRNVIRQAGARLVSITEPLVGEDSASAFLYEGMVATINQFQSMQTAEKVSTGMRQKASVGGTYNWAPLGYVHTLDELADGRKIRTVAVDPTRGHFITTMFQLYASGEYSISQLVTELNRLGLTTRATRKLGPQPVCDATVHRLLHNRYFVGDIVYKRGKPEEEVFPGRHQPLIDVDTFERVQLMLDHKRVAGERAYKHQHYLKGSIFCGSCGRRLIYAITSGRNKKYPYFFCSSRTDRNLCNMRFNIAPEKIEAAISEHYKTVQLTPEQVERAKQAIRNLAEVSEGALHHIRVTKEALIAKLEAQQDKLLDLHLDQAVSQDVFKRRQAKLEHELHAARASLAETELHLAIDQAQLSRALELAEDVQAIYEAADRQTRRGYNQAFFKKLLVDAEAEPGQRQPAVKISGVELTEPYAVLLAKDLIEGLETEAEVFRASSMPAAIGPEKQNGASNADPVSNFDALVPPVGLEPTTSTLKRRALYQLSYEGPTSLDSKAPPPWCSG